MTPLMWACWNNDKDTVRYLLVNGAKTNLQSEVTSILHFESFNITLNVVFFSLPSSLWGLLLLCSMARQLCIGP